MFSQARERGGYVCKEAESIAHGYHHAPSPHDVHRVGRGRTLIPDITDIDELNWIGAFVHVDDLVLIGESVLFIGT